MIKLKSIPNYLTISRIIIIPLIVISFYFGDNVFSHRFAAILFLYASITDFFDGYLARALEIQSNFGRMLDPIADKLLVGAVILMLVKFGRIDIFPALAIICREILVSGLREFLAEIRVSLPVTSLSKIKTAAQMTALFVLLIGSKGSNIEYAEVIGRILIWTAAILTLVTGYAYIKSGMKYALEE